MRLSNNIDHHRTSYMFSYCSTAPAHSERFVETAGEAERAVLEVIYMGLLSLLPDYQMQRSRECVCRSCIMHCPDTKGASGERQGLNC